MTHGLKFFNAAGETVIDADYPIAVVDEVLESTHTGTASYDGASYFVYDGAFLTSLNLAQLDVGDYLLFDIIGNRYLSNRESITVRKILPLSDYSPPSGFGLSTFNAAGDLTYSSDFDMMTVQGLETVTEGGGTISLSSSWVALIQKQVKYLRAPGQSLAVRYACGVERASSTTYQYADRGISGSSISGDIPPGPITFLAA